MVHTAKLTEKLIVQEIVISASTIGADVSFYKNKYVLYGSITTQRGNLKEADKNKEVYSDMISMYLRYIDLPKKGIRICYNGEYYKIINITSVQRKSALVIDMVLSK